MTRPTNSPSSSTASEVVSSGVAEGVGAQALHVVAGPPLGDAGLQQNLEQAREVGLGERAQGDAVAVQ